MDVKYVEYVNNLKLSKLDYRLKSYICTDQGGIQIK